MITGDETIPSRIGGKPSSKDVVLEVFGARTLGMLPSTKTRTRRKVLWDNCFGYCDALAP